jgi:hypothetical protein
VDEAEELPCRLEIVEDGVLASSGNLLVEALHDQLPPGTQGLQ